MIQNMEGRATASIITTEFWFISVTMVSLSMLSVVSSSLISFSAVVGIVVIILGDVAIPGGVVVLGDVLSDVVVWVML